MKKLILLVGILILSTVISFGQQKLGINIGNKAPELIGQSANGETTNFLIQKESWFCSISGQPGVVHAATKIQ
jgi:hypothetical protein